MTHLDEVLRTLTVDRGLALRRRRVRIQVVAGVDAGRHLDFDERARIGSRSFADLALRDPRVSGLHCEIETGPEGELRVRDLGSKNGTWLGTARILEAVVPAGTALGVGDTELRLVPTDQLVDVELHPKDHFHGLYGRSGVMRALNAKLARLAASDETVLVLGETGTGKERVAEVLHEAGPRRAGPLEIVDCGALPQGIIESELFGHEKGAFTGATLGVAGAFERAHGGTVFLDEVGELPLELQPKLLRALEARSVRRLGAARPTPFDARVIAATHRDLAVEVSRGRFREDLYSRLAVVSLAVPPLRERIEDLPLLAVHLLRELGVDPASCLTVESLEALSRHDWPGNVRELRSTLERAAALGEPIDAGPGAKVAPPTARVPAESPPIDLAVPLRIGKQRLIDRYERGYVERMLAACDGNVSEAARRAGMDRMSIHRLLQRLRRKDEE